MNIEAFLYSLPIMVLITFGLVSIGLILASFMESLESFGVIQTFVNLPLFFLSGSIFPLDHVRGAWSPLFPLEINLLAVALFDVMMIVVGTVVFGRRR